MKIRLKVSILATLVAASIGMQSVAFANNEVLENQANVKPYVNNQQRSLYQVALLSGISIAELRELNQGLLDDTDIVKPGERILLPATSPLLIDSTSVTATNSGKALPTLASNSANQPTTSADMQVASALKLLGEQDWDNMSGERAKNQVKDRVSSETESYIRSQVDAQIVDPIEAAARSLLGRFGTVELDLNVSDEFSLRGSSLKLFSPWYDSDRTVIFTQMSVSEHDSRTIGNFGVGQRWDATLGQSDWLFGYNVFFDHDFTRNHNRIGAGLEAWSNYLRLTANYYTKLSDWKESKDFDNYLERAATGFDLKVQGYLPSYPHLGASLKFEQYYGDEVGLFGKDRLDKDPYAVTAGVDYTPVPLVTVGASHRQGKNYKDAKVDIKLNYRLGVPLKDQLDPNKVAAARSLKGSRYDFVDRNNDIVLEYKQQSLSVDLAAIGYQVEGAVVQLAPTVNSKNPISSVTWSGDVDALKLTNSLVRSWNRASPEAVTDLGNWQITVPAYLPETPDKKYQLQINVEDSKGLKGSSNLSFVQVLPDAAARTAVLALEVTPEGYVKLDGSLSNNGVAFIDPAFFEKYPESVNGYISDDAWDYIITHWNVVDANNKEVGIIRSGNENDKQKYPVGTSFVELKEIFKVNDNTGTFGVILDLKGQTGLSAIVNVEPYGKSEPLPLDVNQQTGSVDFIELYLNNGNEEKLVATAKLNNGSFEFKPEAGSTAETYIDNIYTIKPFNIAADGQTKVINTKAKFAWYLSDAIENGKAVGNKAACLTEPSKAIVLNGANTYRLNAEEGQGLTYKVGSTYTKNTKPELCAGEQGFNIKLVIEE